MSDQRPKLRTVTKSSPPYPLNKFPKPFPYILGKELIFLLAIKEAPSLQGSEWEAMFAKGIGAEWKPSNVGLDDVVLGNTAWGAKSVKNTNPGKCKKIRLISGRNSPTYSFDSVIDRNMNPNLLGNDVLSIWNERVSSIREKYMNLRTVVLIKSEDLTTVCVFEFETIRYDPELFSWGWNKKNNLEGVYKATGEHRLTWQPHGSQFTIHENVPENKIVVKIKKPEVVDRDALLKAMDYSDDWITVVR